MPTISGPPGRWEALGQALQRKRTKIDTRYRDRSVFSRERDINDRMLGDLERARRHTYRDTTLRAIEIAYGLEEEAISRFVQGETDEIQEANLEAKPPASEAGAAPLSAPASEWDGELHAPEAPLEGNEVLRWRQTERGRYYRLYDDLDVSHTFGADETPAEVIDGLRGLLNQYRANVEAMEQQRARR